MKNYELMYILRADLEEEKQEAILERLRGIIEADGEIENVDDWGNRKLAYEIDKKNDGHYMLLNFKAGTDVPKELRRVLGITDGVMRVMVVKLDKE